MKKLSWLFAISGFALGTVLLHASINNTDNSAARAQQSQSSQDLPFIILRASDSGLTTTIALDSDSPDPQDCPSDDPTYYSCVDSRYGDDASVIDEGTLQLTPDGQPGKKDDFDINALPYKQDLDLGK